MFRRLTVLLAVLLVLPTGTAWAEPRSEDVRASLAQVLERLNAAEARQTLLSDKLVKLRRDLDKAAVETASISGRISDRARVAYMTGMGADPLMVVLSSADPNMAVDRLALLSAATSSDDDALLRARVLRRQLRATEAALAEAEREAAGATADASREAASLQSLFTRLAAQEQAAEERAQALAEKARRDRLARQRAEYLARTQRALRASRARTRVPRATGRYACLVGPVRAYADTWGAPRSGGRTHKGTDVFAPYGSPAYAVTDGVITRTGYSSLGGITLYLRGDNGDVYYYAHNAENLVRAGQRVAAGEQIARVGDSGNAKGTSPHIHFERRPGGGAPVNPYPFVKRICG